MLRNRGTLGPVPVGPAVEKIPAFGLWTVSPGRRTYTRAISPPDRGRSNRPRPPPPGPGLGGDANAFGRARLARLEGAGRRERSPCRARPQAAAAEPRAVGCRRAARERDAPRRVLRPRLGRRNPVLAADRRLLPGHELRVLVGRGEPPLDGRAAERGRRAPDVDGEPGAPEEHPHRA